MQLDLACFSTEIVTGLSASPPRCKLLDSCSGVGEGAKRVGLVALLRGPKASMLAISQRNSFSVADSLFASLFVWYLCESASRGLVLGKNRSGDRNEPLDLELEPVSCVLSGGRHRREPEFKVLGFLLRFGTISVSGVSARLNRSSSSRIDSGARPSRIFTISERSGRLSNK